MSTPSGYVYAFDELQVWRVNSNGVCIGQLDPANLVNDTTSHALRSKGAIEIPAFQPTIDEVSFFTNQTFRGRAFVGLSDTGSLELSVGDLDANMITLLRGGSVDTTSLTETHIFSDNKLRPAPYDIGLMATGRIQSNDASTLSTQFYISIVIPIAQATYNAPGLSQSTGQNPNTGTITLQPKVANKHPHGVAFGTNTDWQDDSELAYFMITGSRMALTVYVQDGTETDYITGYLPTSNGVTSGNTRNWFAINGAVTAPTSISTSTGVVVKAAAGTAGQLAHAWYWTDFAAIP